MARLFVISCSYIAIMFFYCLTTPVFALERQIPQQKEQIQLSFAPLVKQAMPAVVNVYAARKEKIHSPFEDDPFFEQFFSNGPFSQRKRPQSALGSGVVVDKTGLIVTNFHVIRDADDIKVSLFDGREFPSKVVLKDEKTDIAILKIDVKNTDLPILQFADSDTVEVGDLVLAIGNPFGVGQTVTSGIVSAQARTHVGISDLDFFIQTDAAINPGNSGGALINMQGHLIGINTAIYSRSGGSVGIGFAIPANLVKAVVNTLKRGNSTFDPPYLGASFQPITQEIGESLGMERPYGALITDIVNNSPADKAGLKVGDVLLGIGSKGIDSVDSLAYRLLTADVGTQMDFTVLRNGKKIETSLTLEALPKDRQQKKIKIDGDNPFSGASLIESNGQENYFLNKKRRDTGVTIIDVDRYSIASSFFQKGDIILNVNGITIYKISDLQNILKKGKPAMWRLEYKRGGAVIQQFIR